MLLNIYTCYSSYTSKVYVKLGAYDLSQRSEYGRYTTEIPLVNLILHENYDSQTYINDIALIRLPVPIMLTSRYTTIFNSYI